MYEKVDKRKQLKDIKRDQALAAKEEKKKLEEKKKQEASRKRQAKGRKRPRSSTTSSSRKKKAVASTISAASVGVNGDAEEMPIVGEDHDDQDDHEEEGNESNSDDGLWDECYKTNNDQNDSHPSVAPESKDEDEVV